MKNLKNIIGYVKMAVKYAAVFTAVIAALQTLSSELEKIKLDKDDSVKN